ncbi:hypothetical protein [Dankookia sp. P2]|uniref:hypothetical protein n=1 Tax=Dankookia sp. P2 TaxID=3423955 RepID=UPI003D667190
MFRLDGKVALVTGAGSVGPGWGNGKATAVLLARAGAQVFGIDITESAAAETRDIIAGEGAPPWRIAATCWRQSRWRPRLPPASRASAASISS